MVESSRPFGWAGLNDGGPGWDGWGVNQGTRLNFQRSNPLATNQGEGRSGVSGKGVTGALSKKPMSAASLRSRHTNL
jgi:hypothetical protein